MKRRAITMSTMQVYTSPIFYFSILGVTFTCFLSVWGELITLNIEQMSVSYFIDLFLGLTMFKKLVVLFAAIPYVTSFCNDWNFQYIKPIVIRTGINRYIWSKVVICFVSGLLTVFLGMILFIFILSIFMPVYPTVDFEQSILPPFSPLALGSFPILYLLTLCFNFSMAAAFWSLIGLTLSSFIPINFVAVATPVIASYFIEELTMNLPHWLNLYLLTRSADVINQGPFISFIYYCFIFCTLSFLAYLIFNYQVKRRIHNEVV